MGKKINIILCKKKKKERKFRKAFKVEMFEFLSTCVRELTRQNKNKKNYLTFPSSYYPVIGHYFWVVCATIITFEFHMQIESDCRHLLKYLLTGCIIFVRFVKKRTWPRCLKYGVVAYTQCPEYLVFTSLTKLQIKVTLPRTRGAIQWRPAITADITYNLKE